LGSHAAHLSKIAGANGKAPAKRQAGSYEHHRSSEIYEDLFNHSGIILVAWVLPFTAKGRAWRPWRLAVGV
jgi:hypothetical protein